MVVQLNAKLHTSGVKAGDKEQASWNGRAAQSIFLASKRSLHRKSARAFGENICLAVVNVQEAIE